MRNFISAYRKGSAAPGRRFSAATYMRPENENFLLIFLNFYKKSLYKLSKLLYNIKNNCDNGRFPRGDDRDGESNLFPRVYVWRKLSVRKEKIWEAKKAK